MAAGTQGPLHRCFLKATAEAEPSLAAVKREPDAADAASSASSASKLSSDKQRYNKFNYRLRGSNLEVKAHYQSLVQAKDSAAIEEFVNDLIEMGPNLPTDYIARKRKVVEEKEHETAEEWQSWKTASEAEGEDALLEMVTAGTVESRKNPKLPANSKIQYPMNLQVRYKREIEYKRSKTSDEKELKEHETVTAASHEAFIKERMAKSITSSLGHSSDQSSVRSVDDGSSAGQSAAAPAGDPRVKVAIGAIRKWHGSWDRAGREFGALVKKSSEHQNTQGCKFENDLKDIIQDGDKIDKKLVDLEAKFLTGADFTDDDIKAGAEQTSLIKNKIKEGSRRASALRPWFKL